MTEYPPIPYITASMLNRYRGRTVRILGRVTQHVPDGSRYVLETVDGATVAINRPANLHISGNSQAQSSWACVTGVVHADELSVTENVVDWVNGEVSAELARTVIDGMHKLPALFAV